jgi:lipopolysaccharide heptosyltransferase I
MRFLVIKPSSLGDVIHALPAVRLIKTEHPESELTWLVNRDLVALAELFGDVDCVLPFERQKWAKIRHLPDLLTFAKGLRREQFDLVFDFQGLLRSGLCAFAADGSRTIGFADAREGATAFYTEKVPVPVDCRHAVDKNIQLVNAALGTEHSYAAPNWQLPDDAQARVDALLDTHGITGDRPLLAVAPVSRWPSKTWPPAFFAEALAPLLADGEADICLLGTAAEQAAGVAVTETLADGHLHNLMGATDLQMMLVLLSRASGLLTNDSGPMHMAAALGTSTVALFGPTDPARTGPYGSGHAVLETAVDCAPCFRKTCPLPEQLCRDDVITPAAATAALRQLIHTPELSQKSPQ